MLLLGMRIPPNYGPEFTEQFRTTYIDLAREKKLPFVPFLLNDIALSKDLMQADEIHPMRSDNPSCWTMSGPRCGRCSTNSLPAGGDSPPARHPDNRFRQTIDAGPMSYLDAVSHSATPP